MKLVQQKYFLFANSWSLRTTSVLFFGQRRSIKCEIGENSLVLVNCETGWYCWSWKFKFLFLLTQYELVCWCLCWCWSYCCGRCWYWCSLWCINDNVEFDFDFRDLVGENTYLKEGDFSSFLCLDILLEYLWCRNRLCILWWKI